MNVSRYRKLRRMEADKGASQGERDNARRLRQRMEGQHPGLRAAAEHAEAQERQDRSQGPTPNGPGPYDTGYYGQGRAPRTRPAGAPAWGDRLRSFLQAAVDEVGSAFTLHDLIQQEVEIDVRGNSRTVHLHIRIPLDALDRVASFTGGSLQEYARLVGARAGTVLGRVLLDYED